MPTEIIVIFLLFFAVLAFAWFYLQRAKARDAGTEVAQSTAAVSAAETPSPVAPAADAHATESSAVEAPAAEPWPSVAPAADESAPTAWPAENHAAGTSTDPDRPA